jgi:hypothetical protein
MTRKMSIPSQVFSSLGPVPVDHEPLDENTLGEISFKERRIRLDVELTPEAELKTFWHEVAHLVLWDSGVHNLLSAKLEENICDAFGTYLAAAAQAGFITVKK